MKYTGRDHHLSLRYRLLFFKNYFNIINDSKAWAWEAVIVMERSCLVNITHEGGMAYPHSCDGLATNE